jgi:hypothetical protein
MKASRRFQPHRKGSAARQPGSALSAMLAGRTAQGVNPQDAKRAGQKAAPAFGGRQAPAFGAKQGLAGTLAAHRKRHKKKR